MSEHNSPPYPEASSRWRPLLLPALIVAASLVIGLVLFLTIWRVSSMRASVTAIVLSVPKPVLIILIILIAIDVAAVIWFLLRPYLSDESDESDEMEEDSAFQGSSYPPQRLRASAPMPILAPAHVINPTTPVPETMPDIEQILPQSIKQEHTLRSVKTATPSWTKHVPLTQERITWAVRPETLISITLLKEVSVTIHIPGNRGTRLVPINAGTKRAQLLAYLAARRGELVHRSKVLYNIFAWRREDGTADDETMGGYFHSHTKLLRGNIKSIVLKINEEAGEELIDPDIDPFVSNNEHWGISSICEVVDLEEVERQHKIIEQARKDGLLSNTIPLSVKEACEQLMAAYPGDFIEGLIKKSPKDFKPWDGRASWAKRYNTYYRSCFLSAKWLLGVFEEQQAQQRGEMITDMKERANDPEVNAKLHQLLGEDTVTAFEQRAGENMATRTELLVDELERQERMYYGRAIEPFKSYALYACSTPYYSGSPFDEKASYNSTTGRFGDRITASEQALRRCLKACAFTENTREANEVYSAYEAQMTSLFRIWGLVWAPSQATLDEWESVKALTNSHRFSAQMPRQIPSKQAV